jgi:hypothetical protein
MGCIKGRLSGVVKECVLYRWVWCLLSGVVVFVQRRDRRNYKWQKVKTIRGVKRGGYLKGTGTGGGP